MAFDFSTNHSIIIFGDPPIIVTGFDRAGLQSMRRNWFSVVLFALALALQAFGPAAANVAMAQASAETRQSFALCLQSGGVSAGDYHPLPGQKDRHRDSCPLCQICCDGIASYEARLNQVAGAPVQWSALSWTSADCALPSPRHEHSHQARAPPVFS